MTGGACVGIDDWIAARLALDPDVTPGPLLSDLMGMSEDSPRSGEPVRQPPPPRKQYPARTLKDVEKAVTDYLQLSDLAPLHAVLGAYAANRIPGDPVWLGVVTGPSRAKTELVVTLGLAEHVREESEISGPAALLSGHVERRTSSRRYRRDPRRAGRLRDSVPQGLHDRPRDAERRRGRTLAALREIYDGSWKREVGADGGRTIRWAGKVGMIFGVTTAIDTAHGVLSLMGNRHILCRIDIPKDGDPAAGKMALGHAGGDDKRRHIAETVAGFLDTVNYRAMPAADGPMADMIVHLGCFVARSRSAIEWDFKQRDIQMVHDSEGPGRLVKALDRLRAGLEIIGLDQSEVRRLILKVGLDSLPKGRRMVLNHLMDAGTCWTASKTVAIGSGLPAKTAQNRLAELCAHGIVDRRAGMDVKADDSSADGRSDYYRLSEYASGLIGKFKRETSKQEKPTASTNGTFKRETSKQETPTTHDKEPPLDTQHPEDDFSRLTFLFRRP